MKTRSQNAKRFYTFRVGDFECTALCDGSFIYEEPVQLLFPDAPQSDLKISLRQHGIKAEDWNKWKSDYTCLLVNTGQKLILIDAGAGQGLPGAGRLAESLNLAGVEAEQVDIVAITHAHPDHIGGLVLPDGSPAFPNANIAILKKEWDFWAANPSLPELRADSETKNLLRMYPQRCLTPFKDRLRFVKSNEEIAPGVKAMPTPGHTPGHMSVKIISGEKNLHCLGDAFLHPIHMRQPDWSASIDLQPEESAKSRNLLLNKIGGTGSLVMCFHFPFPGLGRIKRQGGNTIWQNLDHECL